ncbi:unnamed protein product [Schistosoma mattheei]|uniref:Uncharacterized protein n=1 Tax=Schistosoma mattheei TaxID=31246 RepID=A0A183Q586_9TREM|nr:unnamed protein product [Schistosoma mattheei]
MFLDSVPLLPPIFFATAVITVLTILFYLLSIPPVARFSLVKNEVVEFFSRDVDYVITNRISSRLASPTIDESPVTSSKQSTSLHNQLSSTSQTPNNLKVPVLIGSKPVNSPVTRGRAMLLAARKIATEDSNSASSGITASSILNQAQTSNDVSVAPIQSQSSSMSCVLGSSQKLNSNNDLLYKARQLGIKILSIDSKFYLPLFDIKATTWMCQIFKKKITNVCLVKDGTLYSFELFMWLKVIV